MLQKVLEKQALFFPDYYHDRRELSYLISITTV